MPNRDGTGPEGKGPRTGRRGGAKRPRRNRRISNNSSPWGRMPAGAKRNPSRTRLVQAMRSSKGAKELERGYVASKKSEVNRKRHKNKKKSK